MCAIGSQFARRFLALTTAMAAPDYYAQLAQTTAMAAPLTSGPEFQKKNVYKLHIKGVHADMEGHGLEAIVETMGYQPFKGFVSRG